MKTNFLLRPTVIFAGIAALCMILVISSSSPASAQDSKAGKTGSTSSAHQKSKVKKAETVTVTATTDSKDKNGKYKVLIIKDVDGKKTTIDTVFSSEDTIDSKDLEDMMATVHMRMGDVDDRMKDIEIYMDTDNDSILNDSTGHHKFVYKFGGNGCCPRGWAKAGPHAFRYNFEMPDVPEPPDFSREFEGDDLRHFAPGIKVITNHEKGQTLSDVLGDIPMSKVKSYKITDRKGGKRIVIDIEDDFRQN